MKRFGIRLRDVLFGGIGTAILYHEVVLVNTAEPLLVFAAFFLLGLVPASRADASDQSSIKGFIRSWLAEDKSSQSDDKKPE